MSVADQISRLLDRYTWASHPLRRKQDSVPLKFDEYDRPLCAICGTSLSYTLCWTDGRTLWGQHWRPTQDAPCRLIKRIVQGART